MSKVHGREMGAGRSFLDAEGGWHWRDPHYGQHFRTCSYCGCINPEDLVAEVGWHAEWADQKYGWPHKFYVTIRNPRPETIFGLGGVSQAKEGPYAPGGEKYQPPGSDYIKWEDLTPEQLEILKADGHYREGERHLDYVRLGPRSSFHAKFYTEHLADEGIPEEVRDSIHRRSGRVFEWTDDGRVRWYPYAYDRPRPVRLDEDPSA